MTVKNNEVVNTEEQITVEERLIRRVLKPRTKEELDDSYLDTVNRLLTRASTTCKECNVDRVFSDPFKPEGSSVYHKTAICPLCGDVQYDSGCEREAHIKTVIKVKEQMGWTD